MDSNLESELIEFAKIIDLASTEVLEGMHDSARGGEGVEYHSSQPYMDGEDARRVDWKRYAATDRLFVNRFDREEKTSWSVLIDSSKSMSYGKKSQWANYWAGAILNLAKIWGDRWSLLPDTSLTFDEAVESLASKKAGVEHPESADLESRPTQRLVVLSDFFWEQSRLTKAIERWKTFSHLYLVQILDPQEIEFRFSGVLEFRDLESVDRLILDAGKVAGRYRKALKALQEDLQRGLQEGSFLMTAEVQEGQLKNQLLKFFEAM